MSAANEDPLASAYAACEALTRAGDYDRWLASLFAPADKRPHLHALLAFNLEIARIPELVSEPRLGEIRLQWWAEALEGSRANEARAQPTLAALTATRERFNLPREPFMALIAARRFDLWNDPAPDLGWLEGYCGETASSLFRLASLVLADGRDPGGADACGHAGLAWAFTGLLRALGWRAAAGRVYVPADLLARAGASPADLIARRATPQVQAALADMRAQARLHLAAARAGLGELAPAARSALRVLALVEPCLQRMETTRDAPFADAAELPSWRKIVALWRGFGAR